MTAFQQCRTLQCDILFCTAPYALHCPILHCAVLSSTVLSNPEREVFQTTLLWCYPQEGSTEWRLATWNASTTTIFNVDRKSFMMEGWHSLWLQGNVYNFLTQLLIVSSHTHISRTSKIRHHCTGGTVIISLLNSKRLLLLRSDSSWKMFRTDL